MRCKPLLARFTAYPADGLRTVGAAASQSLVPGNDSLVFIWPTVGSAARAFVH